MPKPLPIETVLDICDPKNKRLHPRTIAARVGVSITTVRNLTRWSEADLRRGKKLPHYRILAFDSQLRHAEGAAGLAEGGGLTIEDFSRRLTALENLAGRRAEPGAPLEERLAGLVNPGGAGAKKKPSLAAQVEAQKAAIEALIGYVDDLVERVEALEGRTP